MTNRTCRQIAGGPTDRAYADDFLKYSVALIGPGDPGPWTIDNAAWALESKAYFLRKVGTDGFRIHYKPTLRKVVNDRRPDAMLRSKVVDFVSRAEFGLASGPKSDGSYERLWFDELMPAEDVAFDAGVFLLTKASVKVHRELEAKATGAGTTLVEPPSGDSSSTGESGNEFRVVANLARILPTEVVSRSSSGDNTLAAFRRQRCPLGRSRAKYGERSIAPCLNKEHVPALRSRWPCAWR